MADAQGYNTAQNEVSKQPEMAVHGERLSRVLAQFRESNDRAIQTLNRFCNDVPPPNPGTTAAQIGPAEPVPGTLASLSMLLERLMQESNRLDSLSLKLVSTLG